jgi:aminoglycoside phosphotransferase (APT) family kinase protein
VPTPHADLAVDAALVRRLLQEQHPDLAGLPLRLVANGWDNLILRLGDDLVVRVPRREAAAHLVRHEQEVLPRIAPVLPVAVPLPLRIGRPSALFPWHWSVLPWLEGTVAADAGMRDELGLARALAEFSRALHRPAPPDAPPNPVRGVPLTERAEAVRARLASGVVPNADAIGALWTDAIAAEPWPGPPLWLHGDLHPANLLVRDGRLVAVLDFGDVTAGDPATDLATAWLSLDGRARAAFHDVLTPDAATWRRARGWAVCMATAMVVTAEPRSVVHRIGEAGLEQALRS